MKKAMLIFGARRFFSLKIDQMWLQKSFSQFSRKIVFFFSKKLSRLFPFWELRISLLANLYWLQCKIFGILEQDEMPHKNLNTFENQNSLK